MGIDRPAAMAEVNDALKRDALTTYLDETDRAQVHSVTGASSASVTPRRVWTPQERQARERVELYLGRASEDEFTENVLAPLFRQLGFMRISLAGHTDKALEFGKDMWIKYRLLTGHWIYFACQVKRDKINSTGSGGSNNVATVLNHTRMMNAHPIFDQDTIRGVLLDHVFINASGEITKAAREFLIAKLDDERRRHIIFKDRADLLDLATDASFAQSNASAKASRTSPTSSALK